ncbi:hypothetical protein [Hymenobacter pini]|uniref:hypothetical protein n=1 Tax=Hymenobacter pini TaxID=2880879 RepID=UPI001CF152BF|nr:hypothetical protein [Hymenobacter pini]MCA8831750.1 hypothetical protein [Hymenobacter pini]
METTSTKQTNQSGAPAASSGPDCERVNTILDQIIVGQEPTAEDAEYFVDNAKDCSPCFDSIEKQHIFIDFVNEHLGRKSAPATLSDSILAKLQREMA